MRSLTYFCILIGEEGDDLLEIVGRGGDFVLVVGG